MSTQEVLLSWLQERPLWQQELARRLMEQTSLTDTAMGELLELMLASVSGTDATPELPPLTIDEFPSHGLGTSARLLAVGSLIGVAAAAPNQTIDINREGLTIVYGMNGSGKSTYARVLKRVLRTVDLDNMVRGDVYVDAGSEETEASAVIRVLRPDEEEEHVVNLHDPEDLQLETISVFDSGSAEFYLDARNTIAYVPLTVRLLARMASAQDRMRSRLSQLRDEERTKEPSLRGVPEDTEASRRISSLSHSTDLEELQAFSALTPDEAARLNELAAALAGAATRDMRADAEAAAQDARDAADVRAAMAAFADTLSSEKMIALRNAAREARLARQAVQDATSVLAGMGRGVGDESWRRMWEAARDFVELGARVFPPGAGDPCPLCLRLTDADTSARLHQLEGHIRSELQQEADAAQTRLERLRDHLDPDGVEEIRELVDRSIREKHSDLAGNLDQALDQLAQGMAAAHGDSENAQPASEIDLKANEVRAWENQRQAHSETLLRSLDPEGHAALQVEAEELRARKALWEEFEAIQEWVMALGRIQSLDAAHSSLATNSLTRKQRELSDSLVSDVLASGLARELASLRCTHLPVDLDPRTSVGATDVALSLAGAYGSPPLSEVLSEGEQRALALAFFLAEVSCAEHDGGIVLDDPVSSLDDQRRTHIAGRLIDECGRRQVVVFTHDLPFMLHLIELAEDQSVPCVVRGMWRHGSIVRRVDVSAPFDAMRLKDRVGKLRIRVQEWDSQPDPSDEDEAWSRVCDLYRDMRVTWERAVEERLFRGVVQRFQRDVKTLKLASVDLRPEWREAVTQGMTRCSYFVHDAPVGTRMAIPGRTELEEDLRTLIDFEDETRG